MPEWTCASYVQPIILTRKSFILICKSYTCTLDLVCTDDAFKCRPPKLELSNKQGFSDSALKELHERLEARASALAATGECALYLLAQLAREFLSEHNQPPTPSLYEQRERRLAHAQNADLERQRRLDQQQVR